MIDGSVLISSVYIRFQWMSHNKWNKRTCPWAYGSPRPWSYSVSFSKPQFSSNQPAENLAPFKCNHYSFWTTGPQISKNRMKKIQIYTILPCSQVGPQPHKIKNYAVIQRSSDSIHIFQKKTLIINDDALSLTQPISTTCLHFSLLKNPGQCAQSQLEDCAYCTWHLHFLPKWE